MLRGPSGSLEGMRGQPCVLGDFRGTILRGRLAERDAAGKSVERGIAALQVGSALELVETTYPSGTASGIELGRLGTPLQHVKTARGEVLAYRDVAVELIGGKVTAVVHFAPTPRRGE